MLCQCYTVKALAAFRLGEDVTAFIAYLKKDDNDYKEEVAGVFYYSSRDPILRGGETFPFHRFQNPKELMKPTTPGIIRKGKVTREDSKERRNIPFSSFPEPEGTDETYYSRNVKKEKSD
uniref:Doublecortin domain-containing protein n=1 Tax=Caenorhabditis tropicalis TaxID=1561998 RepID=A0A1I7T354_9PELO